MPLLHHIYPDYSNPAALSALEAAHAANERNELNELIENLTRSIGSFSIHISGIHISLTSPANRHLEYKNKTLHELDRLELDLNNRLKKLEQAVKVGNIVQITTCFAILLAMILMLVNIPVGMITLAAGATTFVIAEFKKLKAHRTSEEIQWELLPAVKDYIKGSERKFYQNKLNSLKMLLHVAKALQANSVSTVSDTLTGAPRVGSSLNNSASFFGDRCKQNYDLRPHQEAIKNHP